MLEMFVLLGVSLAPTAFAAWLSDPKRQDPRAARPPSSSPQPGEVEVVGRVAGEERLRGPISGTPCVAWQLQIRRTGRTTRRVDSGDARAFTLLLDEPVGGGARKVHVPLFESDLRLRPPMRRIRSTERARIGALLAHGGREVAAVGEGLLRDGDHVRVVGVLEREPVPRGAAGYRGEATRWILRALPARGGMQVRGI